MMYEKLPKRYDEVRRQKELLLRVIKAFLKDWKQSEIMQAGILIINKNFEISIYLTIFSANSPKLE